ncbi:hypothetical protein [Frankia sp. AgB32]|uniref:hypothetical protein n=1 Tax=Frankia sp. AgB32 TaxID=631119 RepID=UPI00200FDF09|nr:hypothetical protein [Frankia sp. AgB32]MCK9897847.1 hypothetical protein [Frankia sp. AgB32]
MSPESALRSMPDLASRAVGGSVRYVSDDFFGDGLALIDPLPARHDPAAFGRRGKIYDGWETRRRRAPGAEFAIIRLAAPAIVRGTDINTAYFRGNYPPKASVEATTLLGYPDTDDLLAAVWTPLITSTALTGDAPNVVLVDGPADQLVTHLRLTIDPDGGVARFRAYGQVVADPRLLSGHVDLAATLAGGRIVACSDAFFGSPNNALAPGRAAVMSDGWETARRRDTDNDWLVVELAAPGVLRDVVIDTSTFIGGAPGWAALSDDDTGEPLVERAALLPDTAHRFRIRSRSQVSRVRLDVYPDGGIARLRVHGSVSANAHETIAHRWLRLLPPDQAQRVDTTEFF